MAPQLFAYFGRGKSFQIQFWLKLRKDENEAKKIWSLPTGTKFRVLTCTVYTRVLMSSGIGAPAAFNLVRTSQSARIYPHPDWNRINVNLAVSAKLWLTKHSVRPNCSAEQELLLFGSAQMTEPFSAEHRTFFLLYILNFQNGYLRSFKLDRKMKLFFGDTARPRDTRILVPEKNRAAQNRTSWGLYLCTEWDFFSKNSATSRLQCILRLLLCSIVYTDQRRYEYWCIIFLITK